MYFGAAKGGLSALTTADIKALTFTDGYSNMGSETNGVQCTVSGNFTCGVPQPTPVTNSINNCLAICGINNTSQPNSFLFTSQIGLFNYDSGHIENHASANQSLLGIANLATGAIYSYYITQFKALNPTGYPGAVTAYGNFGSPLLAGAIGQSNTHYSLFLQTVLGSSLLRAMLAGSDSSTYWVCAWTTPFASTGNLDGDCPTAYYSPITEKWRYSLAHWWEVDPANNNDWSVSSPGAYGFYPWIEPLCPAAGHPGNQCLAQSDFDTAFAASGTGVWSYYGFIGRQVPSGTSPTGNGQTSAKCGQALRKAYLTGVEQ
jgi:hypothetical protein